ncbi:hypothetical protein FA15DRAFT_653472 [Coprinopsis marcescibilis]|uniref:Uncharacterized protein n=1 Tax=Coprinopsis marcescibilis TaxID=230819 RepID=A0A5C3L4P1_COPMA|nr:hypothetical protein FA15DRAFT_653472 [Coprinopsis marcescibilis]
MRWGLFGDLAPRHKAHRIELAEKVQAQTNFQKKCIGPSTDEITKKGSAEINPRVTDPTYIRLFLVPLRRPPRLGGTRAVPTPDSPQTRVIMLKPWTLLSLLSIWERHLFYVQQGGAFEGKDQKGDMATCKVMSVQQFSQNNCTSSLLQYQTMAQRQRLDPIQFWYSTFRICP